MRDQIDTLLTQAVVDIIPSRQELEKVLKSGKQLTIYYGIDPSDNLLHLGHAAVLRKLRKFQELGHKIILLVGDFTARIGDPTGKISARTKLSQKQVVENARNYKQQAAKIISFTGPNPAEIKFNSKWLAKLTLEDIIELASLFTVQQLIEREMFSQRQKLGKPIYLNEFIYPVLQGYDSVVMEVDMEIGGVDQTFNMLIGRQLLKTLKNKEKFVLTIPLLPGTDGQKMSKTAGNFIAIETDANDMFGKIMSISDNLMASYFELLTDIKAQEVSLSKPMAAKKRLSFEIVKWLWGEKAAKAALSHFENVIQKRQIPQFIPEITIKPGTTINQILVQAKLARSLSEAKRLIKQGAISSLTPAGGSSKIDNGQFQPVSDFIIKKGNREYRQVKIKNGNH